LCQGAWVKARVSSFPPASLNALIGPDEVSRQTEFASRRRKRDDEQGAAASWLKSEAGRTWVGSAGEVEDKRSRATPTERFFA
jgi:hypothetical protein